MSTNRVKATVLRAAIIAIGALAGGIIVNEFHTRGIRWQVLKLSLPWVSDDGWMYVSADSAFFMFLDGDATFIDIRDRDAYRLDHIQGAFFLPFFEDFSRSEKLDALDTSDTIILYDLERDAPAPRLVARHLVRNHFQSVNVMRGGYIEWLDRGFPVEPGEE